MKRKVILFGGTFDPIHLGHTRACLYALEEVGADKIVFVPAKRSPHKDMFPVASDSDRIEMIGLATGDDKRFEVSDCELKRPSPSYTLDTVEFFLTEYGKDTHICWLVGADAVKDLAYWYKVDVLVDQCDLCVMYRGGFSKPDFGALEGILGAERVRKLVKNVISGPAIDVASSEIRRMLAVGERITGLVAESVEAYIIANGLYKGH